MEATIQNLFADSPYFAFAGFVAMVAVSLYIIKKLKNLIIGTLIAVIALGIYLYRIDVIDNELIKEVITIGSPEELKPVYDKFLLNKKDEIKAKTKQKIIETLEEEFK